MTSPLDRRRLPMRPSDLAEHPPKCKMKKIEKITKMMQSSVYTMQPNEVVSF